MNENMAFNQITLITDGFSNYGITPVEAARRALSANITVNVIGITDGSNLGRKGQKEVEEIAKAGGGLYQIVPLEEIAGTVQMVTQKAINKTIQQVVNSQLQQILGQDDLTSIPPSERIKVARMMDGMAEYSKLNVLLLIDQSSSMIRKMPKVKEAILDFQLSLQARAGQSNISILTFPGSTNYIDIKIPWANDVQNIELLLYNLQPKGNTPTGPALLESIQYFYQHKNMNKVKNKRPGVLDEFII